MKRFLTLLTLLLSLTALAQRPKVGVVLCGGGAKGAAHVGVLKVLEENGIPVDYIAGTSMGALIGGLYAIGYTASELDSILMVQDWDYLMSDRIPRSSRMFERKQNQDKFVLQIPFGAGDYSRLGPRKPRNPENASSLLNNIPLAVVNGQNIYNLLTHLSVGYQDSIDFSRMPIPFACVAVDLVGKKEVVFRNGNLVDALRASMAIPGYFAPVRLDDMVLVDGGILNNYPADVCREMGADIVIGVILRDEEAHKEEIDNIGRLASEILNLYVYGKLPENLAATDLAIYPDTKGYSTLAYDTVSLRKIMDNGEAAAREHQPALDSIKALITHAEQDFIGPVPQPEKYRKAVRLDRDSITLGSVTFRGLSAKDYQLLLRKSCLKPGARISGTDLKTEIARFYNTAAFESVTYLLRGQEPYDLELNFVPGRKSMIGVGLRLDSEEIAAVLASVGINENTLYGSKFNVSAKIAYNLQAQAQYSYVFRSLAQFKAGYHFRTSNFNLKNPDDLFNLGLDHHTFNLAFSNRARNISIDLGARMELFQYRGTIHATDFPGYDIDFSRNKFPSAYARFQADSRNDQNFPTRGTQFDAGFAYCFNRLFDGDHGNFMTAQVHFSGVIPMGRHFALITTIDNRTLFGDQIPMAYANVMGGRLYGRYMNQQLPFIGFGRPRVFQNVLTDVSLDLRYQFLNNNYVFLSGAYARDFQNLDHIFENAPMIGASIGYAYNSFIGPLSFNLFWSNLTRRVGAYISIGYNF